VRGKSPTETKTTETNCKRSCCDIVAGANKSTFENPENWMRISMLKIYGRKTDPNLSKMFMQQ
jgi:hypothetical protein